MPLLKVGELVGPNILLRIQTHIPAAERIDGILFVDKVSPKQGIFLGEIVIKAPQIIIFVRGLVFDHGRLARAESRICRGVDVELRRGIKSQHRVDLRSRHWIRRSGNAGYRNGNDLRRPLD